MTVRPSDHLSDSRGAREGQRCDVGVLAQVEADGGRGRFGRGQDVEDARGEAGLLGQLGQGQRRQGRVRGGLDDARAAGRQRRPNLPRDHGVGEVPLHVRNGAVRKRRLHLQLNSVHLVLQ